jgi:nucleotide-binding universal stress UspA family protein
MSGIICAIRGGPSSQPTVHKAIEIAQQNNIAIYFLYVVNLDFIEHSGQARLQVIKEEMKSMGETICLKAQIEAKRADVESEVIVKEGKVTEEIITASHEVDAQFVILGQPEGEDETNVFDRAQLNNFVELLEKETGAKVIFSQRENDEDQE